MENKVGAERLSNLLSLYKQRTGLDVDKQTVKAHLEKILGDRLEKWLQDEFGSQKDAVIIEAIESLGA